MSTRPKRKLTPAEYLAIERAAETKSEYYEGEMFAMVGASREHNRIVVNLVRELSTQLLTRNCDVFNGDLRVKVPFLGLYTYPDVAVVCGDPVFEDAEVDTLLNPNVIVEVLSPSTEAYDRGKKFEFYRATQSLAEYVLVAQDRPHIETFSKGADGHWTLAEATGLDASLKIATINCIVPFAKVYHRVTFAETDG